MTRKSRLALIDMSHRPFICFVSCMRSCLHPWCCLSAACLAVHGSSAASSLIRNKPPVLFNYSCHTYLLQHSPCHSSRVVPACFFSHAVHMLVVSVMLSHCTVCLEVLSGNEHGWCNNRDFNLFHHPVRTLSVWYLCYDRQEILSFHHAENGRSCSIKLMPLFQCSSDLKKIKFLCTACLLIV